MPSYIVKADPNVDLYIEWSTIVDAPLSWGTAAEMRLAPERKERADRTGTSSHNGFEGWDDGEMIISELGHCTGEYLLPRKDLLAFITELAEFTEDVDGQQSVLEKYAKKIEYEDAEE